MTLLPLLPGARKVTVTKAAAETEGSHAGLQTGHTYTVDQIFSGLLLVSGNDCAEALAAAAGGRAATVARMNATALRLGAYDTFVETPSGLDGWRQLTSAYDMTLVLRAALAQPRFLAYDRAATSTLPGTGTLANQNELFLTTVRGALAAKTGFTDAAQHTFVGAIRRGGHTYGVVLMRAQRWPRDQWQQATSLVTWARSLPAGTPPVGTLPLQVAAARSSAAPSATSSAPHPTTPPHARAARGGGDGGDGTVWWPWALGGVAVAAGGVAGLRRRGAAGR